MSEWRDYALCSKIPLHEKQWFFGDANDGLTREEQHVMAQGICYECPVQIECLHYAIKNWKDIKTDVWGGLTSSQRKRYILPALRNSHPDTPIDGILADVIERVSLRVARRQQEILEAYSSSDPSSSTDAIASSAVRSTTLSSVSSDEDSPTNLA